MPRGSLERRASALSRSVRAGRKWAALVALGLILEGCGAPSDRTAGSFAPGRTGTGSGPGAGATVWSREADRWMGTPYRWGGTDRQGIDCSGFVQQVHARVSGVRLPRTTTGQFRVGRPAGRRDLRPGDLVFFDTSGRGVSHVGLMLDGDRFAHASVTRGVTVSRLSEDYWNRRCLGCRRVP